MSRSWHIVCADCASSSEEPNINHGEAILRDMITIGRHLAIMPREREMDYEIRIFDYYLPMWFFREHGPHRLILVSEYGDSEEVAPPAPLEVVGQGTSFAGDALGILAGGVAELSFRIDESHLDERGVRVITRATPLHLALRHGTDG